MTVTKATSELCSNGTFQSDLFMEILPCLCTVKDIALSSAHLLLHKTSHIFTQLCAAFWSGQAANTQTHYKLWEACMGLPFCVMVTMCRHWVSGGGKMAESQIYHLPWIGMHTEKPVTSPNTILFTVSLQKYSKHEMRHVAEYLSGHNTT